MDTEIQKDTHTHDDITGKYDEMPTIALIYDFDGTLSPSNMQEYEFLRAIGIDDSRQFWNENDAMMKLHDATNVLCCMRLMIEKSRAAHIPITRSTFRSYGAGVELYTGVKEWFGHINRFGKRLGVQLHHYINSSGLKEMIEGTPIAKEFREIYACTFMYDENGVAVWPAVAVDFTAKTQFLFMINKGVSRVSDSYLINEYLPESERPQPFNRMIYFGDGFTDVPCMKLVKQYGGKSIAIYNRNVPYEQRKMLRNLVTGQRVDFACEGDYRADGELSGVVQTIIRKMKADYDFDQLAKQNRAPYSS